jgi:ubiquinone/menaquinone biosynthesis C-methylase UbiE
MVHVLDLGCGTGTSLAHLGVLPTDKVVGVDVRAEALAVGRRRFPERTFCCARGEALPMPDASFDRVVAKLALPYMDIPRVLVEVHRVLAPGGAATFGVHPWWFTVRELRRSVPRPMPTLYRCYVFLSGAVFHLTGHPLRLGRFVESFQTERGMHLALRRAGFRDVVCKRPDGRLVVEALKPAAVLAEKPQVETANVA